MTGVQSAGTDDVLSDMILVLDSDLNLVWAWDAIQWLDPKRLATLKETCTNTGEDALGALFVSPNRRRTGCTNALELTDYDETFSIRRVIRIGL